MAEFAKPRVLIVDDDPTMAAMLRQILTAEGYQSPEWADTGRAALALDSSADIVLLDHQLPDTTGVDLLETLRHRPGHPSVIMVTGHGDEMLASLALRRGADDYLIKDASLPRLLPQVLERVRRIRALREALAAAERDLVHAERLAAIGEMTVTLHHELNNPLMAAGAALDLLAREAESLKPAQRESLETLRNALDRIAAALRKAGDLQTARPVEYIEGIRMIALHESPQAGQVEPRGEAVLWIPDRDLRRVISLLLRHGGFVVRETAGPEELTRAAGRLGTTLVVVAPPAGGGLGLTPPADRPWRLVVLNDAEDATALREVGADVVMNLPIDPGSFTEDLLRTLND